ncbi:hypothetical protein CYY_008280 [Polysphondylium violaceum]|uniref:Uncharacterized protein n=1 Tax=Polysphondylium violaceum TaxID=133409 RepID=A0A8J4UX29_9MYCE|nr:hypothetical protein CYY_008280 [Polysphondylium violaceum]
MSAIPDPKPDKTIISKLPNFAPSEYWELQKGSTYRMLVGELRSLKIGSEIKVNMWDTNNNYKTFQSGQYADFKSDVPGPTYIVQKYVEI